MMNRIAFTLALLLASGLVFTRSALAFDDVPIDHWAYDAIDFLQEEGLIEGYPDGTFMGNRPMSRYELAMVVSRMYSNFLKMMDEEMYDPGIDVEAVLDMLMDEFQPELDELRELVMQNTGRIETLETDFATLGTQLDEINTLIDGMHSPIQPFGDLRVRMEGKYPDTGLQTQRPRYRFRFGFTAPIADELTLGARFATGSIGGITSTNQTIDDAFGSDGFFLDRAYLQWQPASAPGFTFWAGKFAPPWQTTPISWDSDVNVEGIAQAYIHENFKFYLGELVPTVEGFYLVAQVGYDNLFTDGLDAAVTYHFINEDAWKHIMPQMQDGTLTSRFIWDRLESPEDYRALESYIKYSDSAGDLPWAIEGTCFMNLEDAAAEAESALNKAAWVQLTIGGSPSDTGDWMLTGEWGRIQANSVLSWLTDADRGSGDHEWWGASWTYRLMRNTDLILSFLDADRISRENSGYNQWQVDIVSKFK